MSLDVHAQCTLAVAQGGELFRILSRSVPAGQLQAGVAARAWAQSEKCFRDQPFFCLLTTHIEWPA